MLTRKKTRHTHVYALVHALPLSPADLRGWYEVLLAQRCPCGMLQWLTCVQKLRGALR